MKARDITGQRFGFLVGIRRNGTDAHKNTLWLFKCDCGNEATKQLDNVARGITSSCGCYQKIAASKTHKKHGMSKLRTYGIWRGMHNRCSNKSEKSYSAYGGRGIYVCDEWKDFNVFYRDMGERPPGKEIDRIDNNGPYAHWNCRWADRIDQANNKRNNKTITHNGECKTFAQWARCLGMSPTAFGHRIHVLKWTEEKAVTTPPLRRGRQRNADI